MYWCCLLSNSKIWTSEFCLSFGSFWGFLPSCNDIPVDRPHWGTWGWKKALCCLELEVRLPPFQPLPPAPIHPVTQHTDWKEAPTFWTLLQTCEVHCWRQMWVKSECSSDRLTHSWWARAGHNSICVKWGINNQLLSWGYIIDLLYSFIALKVHSRSILSGPRFTVLERWTFFCNDAMMLNFIFTRRKLWW